MRSAVQLEQLDIFDELDDWDTWFRSLPSVTPRDDEDEGDAA